MDAPVAFVTGGASGIGRATVLRFAGDGFRVIAADRDGGKLDTLAREAPAGSVEACVLDICDRPAAAIAAPERLDALVCVAGIYQPRAFDAISDADFREMLDVNLIGVFIAAQEVARRMTAGARIVTVSSRAAIGGTNFAHYVASKAGVVGLTRAMAMELRPRQIAVNSVAPGFTDTPMTRAMPADQTNMPGRRNRSSAERRPMIRPTSPGRSRSWPRPRRASSPASPCSSMAASHWADWDCEQPHQSIESRQTGE